MGSANGKPHPPKLEKHAVWINDGTPTGNLYIHAREFQRLLESHLRFARAMAWLWLVMAAFQAVLLLCRFAR